MPGLVSTSQVGVREDLSDVIAVADAASTPLISTLRKDKQLGNRLFQWQVDDLDDESTTSILDGTDVDTSADAKDAADQTPDIGESYDSADVGNKIENTARRRVLLSNYGHYFRRAFRVSPLAENVNNVAGLSSELAKGLAKTTQVVKRSMEKVFLGTQDKAAQSSVGDTTRGLGSWCNTAHYSGNETHYTPNSESLKSVSSGTSLTDSDVQDVLQGLFKETGSANSMTLIAGTALRRAFTNLVADVVTVANNTDNITATTIRTMNQKQSDSSFAQSIDVFQGDFGRIAIVADLFTPDANTGYVIDPSKCAVRYGMLPRSKSLTNNGGGEGRYIEAYAGLVVDNPKTLGRILINQ